MIPRRAVNREVFAVLLMSTRVYVREAVAGYRPLSHEDIFEPGPPKQAHCQASRVWGARPATVIILEDSSVKTARLRSAHIHFWPIPCAAQRAVQL